MLLLSRITAALAAASLAIAAPTDRRSFMPSGVDSLGPRSQSEFCSQFDVIRATGGQSSDIMCVDTPQGLIPDVNQMVSTFISKPDDGDSFDSSDPIEFNFNVRNLDTSKPGLDLTTSYLMAPQTLGSEGTIEGFPSLVVQRLPSDNRAPDPTNIEGFQSFAEGFGESTFGTIIPSGTLSPGTYRACVMNTALAGQFVVMPVAQRAPQDDCIRFSIRGDRNNLGRDCRT